MGCNSSKAPDYPDGTTKAPAVEDPKATPAIEPASVQPTIPAPDAADEPEEAPVEYKLAADRLAKVQQIFKLWDFNETGKLELSEFTGITVQMGPHESKVLSTLSEMDFDGDGNVVPSEWEQYFAMTCSTLDDAEFGVLIGDIEEAGSTLVTVLQCTQIAKSASTEAAAPAAEPSAEEAAEAAEEEAAAAPTPLTAARQAAVEELFAAWDVEKKGCIPVGQLQQGKLSFGPQVRISHGLPRPPATSHDLPRPPATSRDLPRPPATSRDLPRPPLGRRRRASSTRSRPWTPTATTR